MAPFNWFNRGNKKPKQQTPEPEVKDDQKQEQKPAPQEEDVASQEPNVAQDYLSWAKAAYQNIQKQKDTDPEPSFEPSPEAESAPTEDPSESAKSVPAEKAEVESLTVESGEAAAPAETFPVTNAEVSSSSDQSPTPSEAIAPAIDEETTPTQETEQSTDIPAAEQVLEDSSSDQESDDHESEEEAEDTAQAATLPFWARADTERQERLERLKAEAVEEPAIEEPESKLEPSLKATAADSVRQATSVPEVELDENFLWSAGVLAAQGRRPDDISEEEITWLQRLRQGLGKTRRGLINQLRGIVGQGPLNQDAVLEIESLLLQADVGIEATDYVIEALQERMKQETLPPEAAIAYLKEILRDMLDQPFRKDYEQTFAPQKDTLNIWLITGVNGAGKTTTIGKLAHMAKKSDYNCLIAAADTFRAAAVEQVKIWGQRSNVDVIANPGKNTDPAAVVFDAISAAQSRSTELLLVDTAGRLQNKKNLMAELGKIRRILDKKAPDAHIESLLVLDATLGQNGLRQAEVFSEAAQLSGVVLTKLDGTAKGGVALAVVKQMGLPIRFVGAGEGIEDLRPFSSYEFVEALLSG